MHMNLGSVTARVGGVVLIVFAIASVVLSNAMNNAGSNVGGWLFAIGSICCMIIGAALCMSYDPFHVRDRAHQFARIAPLIFLFAVCTSVIGLTVVIWAEVIDMTQLGFRNSSWIPKLFLLGGAIGSAVGAIACVDVIAFKIRGRGIV